VSQTVLAAREDARPTNFVIGSPNGRAFSAVPEGLEAQDDPFPALKRRAIFWLSLRDKVVCANFILFSKSCRTSGGKFLILEFVHHLIANFIYLR
jgi:hypothetical protein